MIEDIQSHLQAIRSWLDHVNKIPPPAPAAPGLSPTEKQQLQAVNKAVEQLTKLGVEIPSDLRSLKLRLSANDVAAAANPQIAKYVPALESLIEGLQELLHAGRTIRIKLKPEAKQSAGKKSIRVTIKQLLDAGFLVADDRLENRGLGALSEAKVLRDGSLSTKTPQGWERCDSLSAAATKFVDYKHKDGWRFWWRVDPDGTRTALTKIRTAYLKQANDS